jgi:hypothetical protein
MYKKILSLFLSLVMMVGPCFSQDRTDRDDRIKRRQDSIASRDSAITYWEDTTANLNIVVRDATIVYQEELIKYLEKFAYYRFGESVNGIYVIKLQNQEYINTHIIIDNSPELDIGSILGNIVIGVVVIVTAIVLPMLLSESTSLIAVIVTNVNAAHVVQASLAGAAIEASLSGITTYIKSGGDPRETFNHALEGAADGFKWGAVLAYGTELSSVAIKIGKTKTITHMANWAGKIYPKTGVPFVERTLVDANGNFIKGVFPVFDRKFEALLPNEFFRLTDARQFAECTKQLGEAIRTNNRLAQVFTKVQLQQIMDGLTPDGLVWHHNEIAGCMQLVDFATHSNTPHTGGRAIWGGGFEFRK